MLPDGSVLVVEIAAGQITRIGPDGRKTVVARPGGGPNGAAFGPDGHLYVCNNGGFAWKEVDGGLRPAGQPADYSGGRIERVNIETGKVEVLYTHCGGNPLKGPNDIVFDAGGGFYFTDHGKRRAARARSRRALLREDRRQPDPRTRAADDPAQWRGPLARWAHGLCGRDADRPSVGLRRHRAGRDRQETAA